MRGAGPGLGVKIPSGGADAGELVSADLTVVKEINNRTPASRSLWMQFSTVNALFCSFYQIGFATVFYTRSYFTPSPQHLSMVDGRQSYLQFRLEK